jgi:hypothetical protein
VPVVCDWWIVHGETWIGVETWTGGVRVASRRAAWLEPLLSL